jgi:hypothetical protein
MKMGNEIRQFRSENDDCIYFYDEKMKRYRKICDIASYDDLPSDVRRQIKEAKLEAMRIMEIPEK